MPDHSIAARLDALKRHGAEAVSFPALKAGTYWWHDAAPGGTGAWLAYRPSGSSWVAVGTPLVEPAARAAAVRRFVAEARRHGKRAVFFGIEDVAPFAGCRTLLFGQQSVLRPSEWQATLKRAPRLREQVRRARAKGVTVRTLTASDLAADPWPAVIDRLKGEWLGSRAVEPMGFLVSVEPFHAADQHRYFIAERRGEPVQFVSAVPIYARDGWLIEDVLRGRDAPNGTSELVIDTLMRDPTLRDAWLTPGLTPLTGPIAWWLRLARDTSVALYDFSGLRRFRARLHPSAWHPVWLAWDRGPAPLVLFDVLRAFTGTSLAGFALRSLVRHANGPPWAVAVPLVAWTALLALLAVSGQSRLLGFSTAQLSAWVVFDVLLAALLFKGARRPRRRTLAALAAIAAVDAALSLAHLAATGLGRGAVTELLRGVATLGPLVGTTALLWAAWRARPIRS